VRVLRCRTVRRGRLRLAALLGAGLVLAACGDGGRKEARRLVERYNRVVAEAYRRGDVRLIDPVVGPEEGKKIAGLIGVRTDFGLTLDAQMLSLEITGVAKKKDEMRVWTKEAWSYRDLRIGTGEQVGEASRDSYEMLYVLRPREGDWRVDEIRFASEPQVGRKQPTWAIPGHETAGGATPETR
jgi:hypothetical protein